MGGDSRYCVLTMAKEVEVPKVLLWYVFSSAEVAAPYSRYEYMGVSNNRESKNDPNIL